MLSALSRLSLSDISVSGFADSAQSLPSRMTGDFGQGSSDFIGLILAFAVTLGIGFTVQGFLSSQSHLMSAPTPCPVPSVGTASRRSPRAAA